MFKLEEKVMSRKRQSILLVFILVIIIAIGWAAAQTSDKEALEIAVDAAGIKGGIEAIAEDQYQIGKYYQDMRHMGYDVQLEYNGNYYFYTVARKDGKILGSKKLNHVEKFPVEEFPVTIIDK